MMTWLHRDMLAEDAHFLKPVGKLSPFAAVPLSSLRRHLGMSLDIVE